MAVTQQPVPVAPTASPSAPSAPLRGGATRRVLLGLLLALASGVLATLAFPPFGWWPLIWVAFVPMVVAQHRVMPARVSGLAVGVGVGAYFAGQLSVGLHQDSVALVFQLLPVYIGLLVAALAWRSRAFHVRTGYRWFVISAPVAWVALDFVRATALGALGSTWGNPVYALYDLPAFLQPVSVFGIYGLELLVLVVNWAVARVVLTAIDRRRVAPFTWRPALVGGAAALVAVAAWGLTSGMLLDDPGGDGVRVAAIQTGVDTDSAARRAEMLRRDFAQTRDAADRGAELVVWREGGVDFDPQVEHTAAFRRLARETGAYLAIGYGTRRDGRQVNEVTLLAPDGEFLGRYGKNHPGTFAGDYSDTGGTHPVYETAIGPIATIICYDLDFTDTARTMTRNGARLIATPSNDVTAIAETHYTHLVFRSIENRVSTVKADSRFDSAVIDPWGRIVTREVSPAGATAATLVADVPLGSGESVFVTLGDWVGWVCVAGMLAFVGLSWWTRRRARLETRR